MDTLPCEKLQPAEKFIESRVVPGKTKGQRVFQAANYLPAHPEVPALQADLKPGVRFKKANYLSPEVLLDKGNEWSDYFDKEFLR